MTKKSEKKAEAVEEQELVDSQEIVEDTVGNEEATAEESDVQEKDDKAADEQSDKQAASKKGKSSRKKSKKDDEKEELLNKITAAEESAKDWQDKYMRLSAEFDNYRKRTLKEKAELTKTANADLLKDILPVIDDFDRGKDTLDKSTDIDGIREGIELIHTKFLEFLRQNGVKEIEAKEQDFDLDFHEALTKIPAPTEELKGKVVDVVEKGYLLNDRVIRYSKVVIGE